MTSFAKIPVKKRAGEIVFAIVDRRDEPRVRSRTWRIYGSRSGYPGTQKYHGMRDGREVYKTIPLHRWILDIHSGDPRQVDHINRDRLDCRRQNLRICTATENAQNQGPHKRWNRDRRDSGIRGVSWHAAERVWTAIVHASGKRHWLGRFKDPAEAGAVVSAFRAKHMPFAVEAR